MTVGQELAKITDLKLFHNHMTIDLVANFFSYGTPQGKRLVSLFRKEIFEEVSKSDMYGLIFTYMWAFDYPEEWEYINEIWQLFESRGAEVCLVELEADYDVRLARNKTENRLKNKPTKRDLEFSEKLFIKTEEKYRLNSNEGEIKRENYLRINNTNIEPSVVAKNIKEHFKL